MRGFRGLIKVSITIAQVIALAVVLPLSMIATGAAADGSAPQNFVASNVTWDGTTLNFDTNVDLTSVPAADPGPYHNLGIFDISSSDGAGLWTAQGTSNISCSATHCTVSNLTNYNGRYGYVTDSNTTQVQFSFWDSNDEFVSQSQANVPWTPVPSGPQVSPINGGTINEGSTYTESGSFSESNATSWTATIDYGEGAGPQPLTLNPDNTFTLSHTYQDQGTYYATFSVTDDQGITSSQQAAVTVHSLPVSINQISVNGNPVVLVNTGASISASYSSPGPLDEHTATVNWGDGTSSSGAIQGSGSGTFESGGHSYTSPGTYTITLTIFGIDGVASQPATTTVLVKTEPAGFGHAYYVYGSAQMTDDHTLTVQLGGMPAADYSGIEVCNYPTGITQCNNNFIVGPGGITYTITNGQYTAASIDISPSFIGQPEALTFYPLDSNGDFIGNPETFNHLVLTLTNAPLAVTGMTSNAGTTSVNVDSDFAVNSLNAFACDLVGATDSRYIGGTADPSTNSCDFQTSDIASLASTNASFHMFIDDEFDIQTYSSETYNFSQFITFASTPTGLTAPSPTNQKPSLSWNNAPGASSYNIYRNGTYLDNTSSTAYTDASATPGTYSYTVTAVNAAGESGQSSPVTVVYGSTPPTVQTITAPATAAKGASINASASFTDSGPGPDTASWNWGDTSSSAGTVTESNGSGSVTGSHTYTKAGSYVIVLTVTGSDGETGTSQFVIAVSPGSSTFHSVNLSGLDFSDANLSGLNMTGDNLQNTTFNYTDFAGTDLAGDNANGGSFEHANFTGADLTGNNFQNANLTDANLTNAGLAGANLSGANLTGANLTGANLKGANLGSAIVTDVIYSSTTCPNNTNSNNDPNGSCKGEGGGL